MMRKLVVCGVLGLLAGCSSSDDGSPQSRQQDIDKNEWQVQSDAGAGYPKPGNPPSCGDDEPAPSCEKFLVETCMVPDTIEQLPFKLCGDDHIGATTIPADAPHCQFGTDQAWLVCCYSGSAPTPQDAGYNPPTEQKDAGSIDPTPQEDASVPTPVDAGLP